MSDQVKASDVKALRDKTGAGMMDSKEALEEAGGDIDRAVEILRVKGQASAAKRSDRGTSEGVVASYIHNNGNVGSLVEVLCETDFVARNEDFIDFANEVALHVAATSPEFVSTDEIPEEAIARERKLFEEKAGEEGKPDDVVGRIVEGQLSKWKAEVTLLEQEHVNADKHDSRTIEQMREDLAAKVGENVVISRIACFRIGG
ncbi:MAG: translation elongation factor Ts [Solirubrobacterales bacterium]|nr:translation elongation factor Ts [Solirubrobacterales bacterium]